MLIETRRDRIIAIAATGGFAVLILGGLLLQYHYGEVLFLKRVLAALANCL